MHDREAEQHTLGAMLLSPAIVPDVVADLTQADFFELANGHIFRAIQELDKRGEQPDPLLVADELAKLGLLQQMERDGKGRAYIHALTTTVPLATRGRQYAAIVKRHSINRELARLSAQISQMAQEEKDPSEIRALIADRLDELEQDQLSTDLTPISETMAAHYAHLEALSSKSKKAGHSSGFRDLDAITHGFRPSFLTILAARPAMGKTAFALNLALNVAQVSGQDAVAFFSLEQAAIELNSRLIAATTKIPGLRLQVADLTGEEWNKVVEASSALSKLPIYIDDSPMTNIVDLRAKCRRIKRKTGLALVVVDYLQLMPPTKHRDVREQEVAELSRGLKALARELDTHVLALSQLSRKTEERADKRPLLSDLRESGSIEQDADQVLFLYRDEYYNRDSQDIGLVECNVAKNRHGPDKSFKLAFTKECGRFLTIQPDIQTRQHWTERD